MSTPNLTTPYAAVRVNEAENPYDGEVGSYIGPAATEDHHVVKFDSGTAEFATASLRVL